MASWTIIIPRWRPHTANELLAKHWAKRGKMKREDADFIAVYARNADVPKATGRRRVQIHIVTAYRKKGGGNSLDDDAVLKSALDALVTAGMLVDDRPRYCECEMPTIERGPDVKTEITLTDLM